MLSAMIEIADFTQFDKVIKVTRTVFIVIEFDERVTQRASLLEAGCHLEKKTEQRDLLSHFRETLPPSAWLDLKFGDIHSYNDSLQFVDVEVPVLFAREGMR